MRTFVALNLPPDERTRIHAALEPLRARGLPVRWVDADALHVTIKFLGDIEGQEVTPLNASLSAVAAQHPPQELRIGGFGAFPSLRRANVLWIGVTGEVALERLQRDAELALSRLGYVRELKPFRAHVTVGRTKSGSRPPDMERFSGAVDYNSTVRIETLDLMRSHLGSEGAHYEALSRWPLGEKLET